MDPCPAATNVVRLTQCPGPASSELGEKAFGTDEKIKPAFAKGIQPGAPALKALFRNGPPHKRMLQYVGPPNYEAVLAWAEAVASWDGSDNIPKGWEVPRKDESAEHGGTRNKDSNKDET